MALVLLMGIPGSGKTYLCRELKEKLGDGICATFSFDDIFNDDGFMEYLWGNEYTNSGILQLYGVNNPSVRDERRRCEGLIREFLGGRLSIEHIVPPVTVVDDIFYLKSMRRPFRRMSTMFHMPYVVILVDTPIAVALERNMQRPMKYRIPESTIRKIHQEIELPTENDDNFIIYRPADNVELLIEHINCTRLKTNQWLNVNTNNSKTQQRITTTDNDKWMKLEIDLRKCINELINEKNIRNDGKMLAKLKKKIYWKMRAENVSKWKKNELKDILWDKFQEYFCSNVPSAK